MMALCNRCKYSWRARKLQTSNRRCPICRSYDIDYAEQGTPVLPSRYIPHEVGSAFIRKRILPQFEKWRQSIYEEDYVTASCLTKEVKVLLEQAERLHANEMELKLMDLTWWRVVNEQREAFSASQKRQDLLTMIQYILCSILNSGERCAAGYLPVTRKMLT